MSPGCISLGSGKITDVDYTDDVAIFLNKSDDFVDALKATSQSTVIQSNFCISGANLHLQLFHMQCQRRILAIEWTDFITNEWVRFTTGLKRYKRHHTTQETGPVRSRGTTTFG